MATLIAGRTQGAALADRIERLFGAKLPAGPQRVVAGEIAFIGTGPGMWLAAREDDVNRFADDLAQAVAGLASVSDQTDAFAVLRVGGAMVRPALCKLLPIDLHPRAFAVGGSAVTSAAHIGVTVWRLQDESPESSVFELAVSRSMAESFWEAFFAGAAEFGIRIA